MIELNNQLYLKIKAGDKNAFQDLFEKYYSSLFFYACKFVDDELARDLVHDIFIIFWQNKENINISSSLSAYLFRMVRNKSLQEIEKQKVRDNYNQEALHSLKLDEISYYNDGLKSIIELELEKKLKEALDKMPDGCRKVFVMSRFDGLKNKEIAEQLDVSVKAVEKQMTKALKILKLELKEYLSIMMYIYFKGSDFL
jgi:RNA polymerase sigma-70 factor (ECF subfamily)